MCLFSWSRCWRRRATANGCLDLACLLQWLVIVSMELVLFFGIATFCAMLTGNIIVLPILLLRRRRMETAGDVVSVKVLRPVFKYCFAVGCALVLGWLFNYEIFSDDRLGGPTAAAAMTGMILLGGCIGYFAAAMLLKKSFRVFDQWRGFAVTALVLLALCAVCEFDLTGYERWVPEASQVEHVWIESRLDVRARENLEAVTALHQGIVDAKRAYDGYDGETYSVSLNYELSDGSYVQREYLVPINRGDALPSQNESIRRLQALLNTREAAFNWTVPRLAVTEGNVHWTSVEWTAADGTWDELQLTPAETVELWETCLLPDLESGAIGLYWLQEDWAQSDALEGSIYIELQERPEPQLGYGGLQGTLTNYASVSVQLTSDAAHALAWLEARGIVPASRAALRLPEAAESEGASPDIPIPTATRR